MDSFFPYFPLQTPAYLTTLIGMDLDQEARLCKHYIQALEDERKKILVFQRELPLCLNVITQAIEAGKQRIGSEEETRMGETPVLEEFMPLKPTASSSGSKNSSLAQSKPAEDDKRPDWLRSVQLWSQEPDPKRVVPQKPIAVNARKLGGAFQPFEKQKFVQIVDRSTPTASSTMNTVVVADKEKEIDGQSESNRKARRCWSPELHRRFLHALQQLGGTHAATPKQLRELMKVDGLTNDEVKSHLQKYRLHTRRPMPTVQRSDSSYRRAPDFVVVGGIWVPSSDCTAAATQASVNVAGAPLEEIYSSVASIPRECSSDEYSQKKKQSIRLPNGPSSSAGGSSQDGSSLGDNGAVHPASTISSSSQTVF